MLEFFSLRTEREADAGAPSPFAGAKKAGTKALAKAQTKKKAKPPEDEEPPADEPAAPPEEPADEPGDEPADAPADDPTEEPAEKEPVVEPEKPEEPEEPPQEEPVKIWQIPMDTILGRTAMDDLERYLKTIAATLQNAGFDLDRAASVVDTVVAQMTQAKLLPPLPAEPSDDEISTWMNAALTSNLASVIIDRS